MSFGGRQGQQGGEHQVDMRFFYTFNMPISMAISGFWMVLFFLVDVANFFSKWLNNSGGVTFGFVDFTYLSIPLPQCSLSVFRGYEWLVLRVMDYNQQYLGFKDVQDVTQPTTYIFQFILTRGTLFSCPGQLNRWPCHSLTHRVSQWVRFWFQRLQRALQSCGR